MRIVLIGMPSSGKTCLGKKLAKALKIDFLDTDKIIEDIIEMRTGAYIREYGEDAFRRVETQAMNKALESKKGVIATGGGMVLREENFLNLTKRDVVVYIDRRLDLLLTGGDRPLSKSKEALENIYLFRRPLYLHYADIVVANNGFSPKKVLSQILNRIEGLDRF